MKIDTNQIVTVTEANRNFSFVTRVAEQYGSAVIFKNGRPQYVLYHIEDGVPFELTEDEKTEVVAMRILNQYRAAFEELAK